MGDSFPLYKTYAGVKEDRSVCCAWECRLLVRKASLVRGTGAREGWSRCGRQLLRSYLLAVVALAAGWSSVFCDWPSSLEFPCIFWDGGGRWAARAELTQGFWYGACLLHGAVAQLVLVAACFAQTGRGIPGLGTDIKQVLTLVISLCSTVDVSRKDGGLHLPAGGGWQDGAVPHALRHHQPQVAATPREHGLHRLPQGAGAPRQQRGTGPAGRAPRKRPLQLHPVPAVRVGGA